MKALFFAKPLEYRLYVPGEQFVQGSVIEGTLTVINRGSERKDGVQLEVGLAYGAFKAIKQSGAEALAVLQRQTVAQGLSLAPGEEKNQDWRFALSPDGPVKTKDAGPFLLYGGALEESGARGQIDLPVSVAPALEAFQASLENHFAFVARNHKYADGFVEVSFKPPAAYPTLEELVVAMRLDEQAATLRFQAKVKTLRRGEGGLQKKNVRAEQIVPRDQFLLPGGKPNRALYKPLQQSLLAEVTPKALQR